MSSPTKHFDTKSVAASTTNTRKTTGSTRSVQTRLNVMADEFNTFYGDLEEETTIRKKAEEDRVARMEREVAKIEKILAIETKRRIEASKALQTMFEAKIAALHNELKEELRSLFEPLQVQVDNLALRVEAVEKSVQVHMPFGFASASVRFPAYAFSTEQLYVCVRAGVCSGPCVRAV